MPCQIKQWTISLVKKKKKKKVVQKIVRSTVSVGSLSLVDCLEKKMQTFNCNQITCLHNDYTFFHSLIS